MSHRSGARPGPFLESAASTRRAQLWSWTGRRFHLGNKEVSDAETFAIYQVLRVLDLRQETGRRYAIFSGSQSAIRRISSDGLGPGQQWARGAAEECTRLMVRQNRVTVHWAPAHNGMAGNEMTDDRAKQAAEGPFRDFSEVPDQVRWQVSLSHLHRRVVEQRSRETALWAASHVRPERRYCPPGGSGLRRKALRRVRKSLTGRYY